MKIIEVCFSVKKKNSKRYDDYFKKQSSIVYVNIMLNFRDNLTTFFTKINTYKVKRKQIYKFLDSNGIETVRRAEQDLFNRKKIV